MGKTLENVIIVVLVIVILYMLFKKERMDGDVAPTSLSVPQATPPPPEITSTQLLNMQTPPSVPPSIPPVETVVSPVVSPVPVPVVPQVVEMPQMPQMPPKQEYNANLNTIVAGSQRCDNQQELDEFIKEYKDYSRFNKPIPTVSSDEEINAYRSSFLDFRMYTDQTSHHMDPVDQMNLEKIAKNNSAGLKVSDVYDRISATNYKPSNIDIVGMQHNEKRNNRFVANQFSYENDNVNNGGFFFGKIMASDVDNESYMPL
jgi:hypothetical protein